MKPTVWTIAGFDSSNGAGVSADLQVFAQLGVHGCAVTTAITAQTPQVVRATHCLDTEILSAQLSALNTTLPAQAIKIGMLGNLANLHTVQAFLSTYQGSVVVDPVLASTSGHPLFADGLAQYRQGLLLMLPFVDLLTPNKIETELLLNKSIIHYHEIEKAAQELISLGAKSVCIKGGHFFNKQMSHDFWTNGQESFWLSAPRYAEKNYRGTGCVFASAVAAALALNYRLQDALVIAKMYIHRGIRLADCRLNFALLHHAGWPDAGNDLPYVSNQPVEMAPTPFKHELATGLYPIVENAEWVERLCQWGVKTLQLRIKNQTDEFIQQHIQKSIHCAAQHGVRLYINDHWQLALRYGAYGVHVGQEDLLTLDIETVRANGLRLGISTHSHAEVARAHALSPSYLACGPVFLTTSKIMPFAPQGIQQLSYWCKMLTNYPWVAIGGINEKNIESVLATGVHGVAMISAITQAKHPEHQFKKLLRMVNHSCPLAMTN